MVVTFVHGWHHSAECCDQNVEGFRQTLRQLSEMRGPRLRDRRHLHRLARSVVAGLSRLFHVLGTQERRRARRAERSEGVSRRLQDLYVEIVPTSAFSTSSIARRPQRARSSFSAWSRSVTASAHRSCCARSQDRWRIGCSTSIRARRTFAGQARAAGARPSPQVRDGFGDLIVLINPAAEASQYHRLHMLSRRG